MSSPARFHRFALIGAIALLAAACGKDDAQTAAVADHASPEAAVMHSVQLLRQGDFSALAEASAPPARVEAARQRWMSELKDEQITDEARAEFAATMERLTAPGAEEQMLAEIRPQLEQFQGEMKAQLPAMVAMGKGFILAAINESEDIPAAQKPQVTNLVNALGTWAESGEFASVERAERAVAAVTATARKMPVRTLDEVHALDFDGLMNLMSIGFGGVKDVLNVYDINIDQTLAGARAETVSQDGDNATVRVHFDLLGAPLNMDVQMVRVDGRWYGKDAVENLDSAGNGEGS
jgi:hypothetical protein